MTKRPPSDDKILARLDASLAEDVLTEVYSDDDVDAALRTAGGDPGAIGRRGADLAARLLDSRRLSWQVKARQKINAALPLFETRTEYFGLGRTELLSRLDQAKNNPRLSGSVRQLFHQRKPEDISDDELRKLLEEVDVLASVDVTGTGDAEEP